ncbi:MAG: protein kinase [Limisphaerales bacterium]
MSQHRVTATLESGRQVSFVLGTGSFVIGRDPGCAVCVPSDAISRNHARLTLDEDGLTLEDLDSTAGTFVNEQALAEPVQLACPATFLVGPVTVTVEGVVADEAVGTTLAPDSAARGEAKPAAPIEQAAPASERYVVGREIAKGGMGAILEAKEPALDREVAMKVMLESGESSNTARQRFVREALVLARLEHPNIVPIHEMGRNAAGQLFYTMKMVKGRTLHAILTAIRKGDAPTIQHYTLDRLLTIYRKVCDAIAFSHHQRIIHRDLKPENVMVGEFGEVLVMDWGLAKHLDDHQLAKLEDKQVKPAGIAGFQELSDSQMAAGGANLTMEGAVMGSPQYMPPEQAEGRLADIGTHSDIYSLGAILYAILTLRHPVEGKKVEEVLAKVISGIITPPTTYNTKSAAAATVTGEIADARKVTGLPHCPDGKVPASLSAVTMRAMALKPADRYATVAQLMADIEAYQGGFATSAENLSTTEEFVLLLKRHKGVTIAAAAALAVIAVLTTVFVGGLRAKEREATRAADLAITEKEKALKAEKEARASSAQAQIALAEAAFRGGDFPAMVQALDACPPDKRDSTWAYLSAKRDGALGPLRVPGFERFGPFGAVPGQPGQFAFAEASGDVGFVDAATGRLLRTVKTGQQRPQELAFSGDGQTFAVRGTGVVVDLHDTATGARRKSLTLAAERVQKIALGHDGSLMAVVGGVRGPVQGGLQLSLIETSTGTVRWQKRAANFANVLIHPEGRRVIASSGGGARFCWIYDAADGREISKHAIYALCQALHPDGQHIAIGSQQGEVMLVSTVTGAVIQQGKLHAGKLEAMAWTADGHLLTMGEEGKIASGRWLFRLWDPEFLTLRATFGGLNPGPSVNWAFHPASGHLITQDNPVRVWRIPAGRELVKFSHVSEQAWGGAFIADTVLVARKAWELARYDLSTPGKVTELPGPAMQQDRIVTAHTATGRFATVQVAAPRNQTLRLRVFGTEGRTVTEQLNREGFPPTIHLAFNADGDRLVATLRNGNLEIISAKGGQTQFTVVGSYLRAEFAGSGGRLVAIAPHTVKADAVEFHLRQLDAATGKTLLAATNRFHVLALAASPDRKLVALGGSDRAVHLFDADTLREQPGFRAHDSDIGALTFHPKQPILATASADGSVKVWDHRTGRLLDYFLGLAGNPVTLSFSPNGKLLMVDGQERTTRVYDVAHVTATATKP